MDGAVSAISFAERFRERFEQLDPPLTQAELSAKTGVDRSMISRLLQGGRLPSNEVLRRLAPALNMDVEDLVRGTDAASRLEDEGVESPTVRFGDHVDVLRQKAELEGRLENERRRREVAEAAAGDALRDLDTARADLKRTVATIREQEQDLKRLRRYERMFNGALSQLQALNSQVNELKALLSSAKDELASAQKVGRVGAILSGIAAITGAATFAHFWSQGGDEEKSEQQPKARSKASKQRRSE